MRKFEISRASPAVSSAATPLRLVLPLKKYNSAGSHKRLIRVSSPPRPPFSPSSSVTLWKIIKAPGVRYSLLLSFSLPLPLAHSSLALSLFVCPASRLSPVMPAIVRGVFVDNRDYTLVAATPPLPLLLLHHHHHHRCGERSTSDLSIDCNFNSPEHLS